MLPFERASLIILAVALSKFEPYLQILSSFLVWPQSERSSWAISIDGMTLSYLAHNSL